MKKLIYLLFLLPLCLLVSCDDNDLPDVDFNVTLGNVVVHDNMLYGVLESIPSVEGISVVSANGNSAALADVKYYVTSQAMPVPSLDGYSNTPPFACRFLPGTFAEGVNSLAMTMLVLQVDKSLATGNLQLYITVVPTVDDLPEGCGELGNVTRSFTVHPDKD